MELKIFAAGFTEKEFNDFITSNIVYKMHFLENGDVYLMWKPAGDLGFTDIEQIEQLDRVVKQKQSEILAHSTDSITEASKIADMKKNIQEFHPNQKEYKSLEENIKGSERAVLMAKASIEMAQNQILTLTEQNQEILNAQEAPVEK